MLFSTINQGTEDSFCFRKLSRLFKTEACLNGSFLVLPDAHFHTSSNNPGIDLDQVINVMEKLRSCDPTIQTLVCPNLIESTIGRVVSIIFSYLNTFKKYFYHYH